MNELSRHIEILLLDNDCVIVPGFGGFVAHHCASAFLEEEESFYPPKRTLGFNPQLQLNDSLLVQSYVEAYDISYPEAIQRIEADVEDIKQTISLKGSYEFSGIGTVCKTSDGRYNFEPSMAGLVTPSLYALNSYVIGAVEAKEATSEQITALSQENVADAASGASASEDTVTVAETEAEDVDYEYDDDDDTISIRIKTLKRIAAAAAILVVFVLTCMPLGKGSGNAIRSSVVDTEFFGKLMNFDTVQQKSADTAVQKKDTQKLDSVKHIKEDELENQEEIAKKTTSPFYSIILASKVSSKGAKELVSTMEKAGFSEVSVYEKGSMRRVIYGAFETEDKAEAVLRKLRKKDNRFSETWVQKLN